MLSRFESFDKDGFIKNKIKKHYIDKYNDKKDFVNKSQFKLDLLPSIENNSKPIEVNEKPVQKTVLEPTEIELEMQYKLRHEDGTRKRYLQDKYQTYTLPKCAKLSRLLRSENSPFLAKIVPIKGEKGDNRWYHAIAIYRKEEI